MTAISLPVCAADDRELLTWLMVHDASFGTIGHLVEVAAGVPVWSETRFVRRPCRYLFEWHCFDGVDERAAIRAAMEAEPCAEDAVHGCTQSRTIRADGEETPLRLLQAKNAQLLNALYDGSPSALALRERIEQRIATAGFLTDESRAAYALCALLDAVLASGGPP